MNTNKLAQVLKMDALLVSCTCMACHSMIVCQCDDPE